jgi:parvulin-like peptidyl-prolyl isomerase
MEMKTRLLFMSVPLVLVAVLAAGCGGGGSANGVPADDIAKVNGTEITKTTFNELLDVAFARFKSQGQTPPKVGTPAYTQLREQAVSFLVQEEELKQEGKKIGVTVTQKDLDARVALIKKTYYHNSQKQLEAALKKNDITLEELETYNLAPMLLSQKLEAKVTGNVKVSNADALKYYKQNKTTYQCQDKCRLVRHILVDKKSLAEQLERKLKNGASFAALAKQDSKDTGSASQGGRLTAVKGQLVPPFQTAAFSLKTGQTSQPVHSSYGWHIIQALSAVEPAHTTQPFPWVSAQIKQNLSETKRQTAWSSWLAKLKDDFSGKVAFQAGYAPVTSTTPTVTGPATTTG